MVMYKRKNSVDQNTVSFLIKVWKRYAYQLDKTYFPMEKFNITILCLSVFTRVNFITT